ncbi:hypothetical protein CTEN210_02231 [Chaetoceros tenuissimus]|uniref:Phytanoyl-CoA dioxygenase n=1 Tax=Chaetoceros tenuissimus TaxID=426638 RepID=A0AAD3CGN2_9STRA|nr:hypothetical protein CTEN210_02231 [Chaetoceros tenuissimus]
MDHLESDEERKRRWYATHVQPRLLPVQTISCHDNEKAQGTGHIDQITSLEDSVPGISIQSLENPNAVKLMKHILNENGFVVIQGVLNSHQCHEAISLAWDYIEAASRAEKHLQLQKMDQDQFQMFNQELTVERNDPRTYSSKFYPRSVEGRIFPFYGSGHSSFMWYIRSNENVKKVFASIYNVPSSQLYTSLDGLLFWHDLYPLEKKQSEDYHANLDRGWFHIDQNPERNPNFASYQGLVNLLPTTKYSGGNVLIAKSHKLFPHHYLRDGCQYPTQKGDDCSICPNLFYKDRLLEINGDDWLEIDPNDKVILSSTSRDRHENNNVVMCKLSPGDLLLWDSRTVHCSHPTLKSNLDETTKVSDELKLDRVGALVNMVPRQNMSEKSHKGRVEAVRQSRTLTHWVNKVAPLGEERSEDVLNEKVCVEYMKRENHHLEGGKVLLDMEDLTCDQLAMI